VSLVGATVVGAALVAGLLAGAEFFDPEAGGGAVG
jgi:hypothetical protein